MKWYCKSCLIILSEKLLSDSLRVRIINPLNISITKFQRRMQFRFKSDTISITSRGKMKLSIAILVVVGLFIGINSDKVNYDNYRVYSVHAKTDQQLQLLQAFEHKVTDLILLSKPSTQVNTDIAVSPQNAKSIEAIFTKYGLDFEVKTNNLQK